MPVFQQLAILFEGFNPAAAGPLTDTELSSARGAMKSNEHLSSFVRGRIVKAGHALWLLTESAVLVVQTGRRRIVNRLALADVQRFTLERGRYGVTLALYTSGQRVSIFGANEALARVFATAMTQSQPAAAASIEAPSTRVVSNDATADAADVATWVTWSRLRLMPTAHQGMAENLVLLREAASLHQSGMLNDAEFGALKGRLLNAA